MIYTLYYEAFIFIITFNFYIFYKDNAFKDVINKSLLYICLLGTVFFYIILINYIIGGDLIAYQNSYGYISDKIFNLPEDYYASINGRVLSEYGYLVLEEIFRNFVLDPTWFLIIVNSACLLLVFYTYKKNTAYYFLAILLYVSRVMYDFQFNVVRAGIASIIAFIAIILFDKKRWKLSMLCMMLAFTFHISFFSIVLYFLIYLWLGNGIFIKIGKYNLRTFIFILSFFVISYLPLAGILFNYANLLPESVSRYLLYNSDIISPTNVFARLIILVQLYFSLRYLKYTSSNDFGIFVYIISLLLYLFFANLGVFAYRMQEVYQIVGFLYFARLAELRNKYILIMFLFSITNFYMFYTRNALFMESY